MQVCEQNQERCKIKFKLTLTIVNGLNPGVSAVRVV